LLQHLSESNGADAPGWHWGGNLVKHPAGITHRKLTSPVVVATSFANAFNLTSAHSIDRLNGLIDDPTQRL